MSGSLRIALAQTNPTVGDLAGNRARLLDARVRAAKADLLVTAELALSGYPPEDLVLKPAFLDAIEAEVAALAAATAGGGPALLIGTPWRLDGRLVNAILLIDEGRATAARAKHHLPNYGVFDEIRVFEPGPLPEPIPFRGLKLGAMICEDMWYADVAAHLKDRGADLLVVPNGSPFETDKPHRRLDHAKARVAETDLALLYVNQVGGQDELVFDGASFALGRAGEPRARLPAWDEAVATLAFAGGDFAPGPLAPEPERLEAIYRALMVGLRDYVAKNRFPGVIIGLSGGIDSALTAAVAADALGADRVRCVMMPSPYTSQDSLDDAAACARLLGIRLDEVSIGPAMQAFETMLRPLFEGRAPDIAEENIQARARGITLMAISNKFGPMVLSTGNKSEMSVGYATLYGDMCGGYSVLKDVYKTTVFALSRWRNAHRPTDAQGHALPVMPERVLTKAPTAELRPNQTDQDTLPPYDMLDAILERLIEGERTVGAIAAEGFDEALVRRVWRMLDRAEYKRRQAPPGVKITSRAFGRDRRYPITNAFSG
jgi:NAD+ synthase